MQASLELYGLGTPSRPLVHSGEMGDISFRRHGGHVRAEGILDRLEAARLVIKISHVVLHEGDEPDALAQLADAHALAGEDLAQIDLAGAEADAAARRHGRRPVV